ncbi:LON peptidase N-terminal domain and RING finger protein 2 [Anguilla rostrata]|uniref:LON peptidase N-terminal domain and ring finger 2 n=1 Tax=Anguilla anguilla TaxID=7936 RepID=A0A9D3MMF0_ANGAN|nr:LON peptidase N-terminal domain and RING finger protein 2 [Anguilla anguilla]XP_035264511.1 LON peptidase N-terminal domain and RING finger protein 2 [Anguilla anguilla]XP_035264512.1 LON peptidase N-terminal domain and RING finger protein 2 [Anguilla anguilla]KAG5851529.1 hypothetical protein ANANG_G00052660 [Anguilla anguilla]
METGIQHRTEQFVHDISNPDAAGLCAEMLEVAEEASRAGDFDFAAEIYGSQLADLAQPDRGLCLRRADALARCGRIAEALDSYCTAASLSRLRSEELGLLVESIARSLRDKNESLKSIENKPGCQLSGDGGIEGSEGALEEEKSLDLFSCRLCKSLLTEPTTLQCGHTFCKRCLDNDSVTECSMCKYKLNKKNGIIQPMGFRVNVILSGLLEKWFDSESKARRYWLEGESLWKQKDYPEALEKYNQAVELAPSDYQLIGQRARLHVDMESFSQAAQEADSMCQLKPLCPEAHYLKATALSKLGRKEEALQEYFLCVALKPGWAVVRREAQKILSEVFSSVFEREGLPTPLRPHQGGAISSCFKPSALPGSALPPPHSEGALAGCSKDPAWSLAKTLACEFRANAGELTPLAHGTLDPPSLEDPKTLTAVLSSFPAHPSLKRKCPSDVTALSPPTKLLKPDGTCSPPCGGRQVPPELLDSADMECSLCMRLFYEPVATPCGHTFCLKCLERCLDHNPTCPLCKENLCEYLATRGYHKTLLMEEVLVRYLSDELAERKKIQEEELKELSNLTQEVPIFVCTMAFPTIPCPLHVFEPRYRLMIRRSMETGTKQFGMCIADEQKGFADYGCMLEVRDVKFFPDGRSVVDTIGVSRFKVLSHGQRDGYNTAKIEYLEDRKVEGAELVELLRLHDSVYEQASAWFSCLKDNLKSQILSHFGNLPTKDSSPQGSPGGPAWCWWLLAVLPLENRAQLTILAMTSLKERLIAIRRVLIFVTCKRAR